MTSSGVRPVASRHSVVTSARRCYIARPTCATFAKNQSRCTWNVSMSKISRSFGWWWKGRKISSWCHGVYKGWGAGLGGGASASKQHQVYYYTSNFKYKINIQLTYLRCHQTRQTPTHQNEQFRLPPARSLALIRLNPIFFHPHNSLLAVSPPIPRVSTRRPPLRQPRREDTAQAQPQHQEDVGRRQETRC